MGHQKITLACQSYCITSTQFGFTPVADVTRARKAFETLAETPTLRRLHNEKFDYGPLNPDEPSEELLICSAKFRSGIPGHEG